MPEGRAEEFNAFPEVSRSHSILYNKTRKSTFCPEFQTISARIPSPSPAAYRGLKGVYFQSYRPPGGQESARYFVGFSNAACRAGIGGSRRYGRGLKGRSPDPGTIRPYFGGGGGGFTCRKAMRPISGVAEIQGFFSGCAWK